MTFSDNYYCTGVECKLNLETQKNILLVILKTVIILLLLLNIHLTLFYNK